MLGYANHHGMAIDGAFLSKYNAYVRDFLVMASIEVKIMDEKQEYIPEKENRDVRSHKSLEQRAEEFYGKPFDQINERMESPELDWGAPAGDEVW